MDFHQFEAMFKANFEHMCASSRYLFEAIVDKDYLWELYLDSFPAGTNQIYQKRREYDCSCCRYFIKQFGGIVAIKNNQLVSIWDFQTNDLVWQPVVDALAKYVKSKPINDVFVTKDKSFGTAKSLDLSGSKVIEWEHLYLALPENIFRNISHDSDSTMKASFRDIRNVFMRSLDEIVLESISVVFELIAQNSLYKGEEWSGALNEFFKLKKEYDALKTIREKENYTWEKSVSIGAVVGKIRNHSIGTLLVNISEGMDLDLAVKKYEAIVAPINYKRPKAIFTQRILDDAKKIIEDLGYIDWSRRHIWWNVNRYQD